ncbi:retrovirus-related Pol polyprotein from transposon opus [Dermacentor silvarum]|uniref:retrovirus-related Pol polyprotein from transposon opus n=1 Tax=Dermacentor silvarum TaxID=543639 RepID=UPI0021008343|nr:retrovirus-related Pol polyprotein from transposon opus [Dermacentor silvarum]
MLPGISPPPPFLVSPGTPAIPWPRWLRLFENFTLASGASELSAARRRALLLHCLGPEGQRIFDALPPPPPSNAPDHPPAHPSAGTAPLQTVTPSATTAAVGTTEIKQADAELAQPPDEYDAAVQALARHFSATCNVRVERHRFRDRRQLHGEPISEFALAFRELASSCNFAAQADTNLCDQFVAGVTCPRLRERLLLEGDALTFDRAVEIALLREQNTNKLSPPTTKPPLGPPKFGMPTSLWAKFEHLFSPELGLAKGVQHRVKLKQSVAPVTQKLRRLPLSVREAVSDELRNLLSADVIECVNASEWVSPIVAARKKDGSIRICVDLREANKAVVVDSFPLPHTEELLHALNGARYFSKLDLASAYYQVLLHPDSRDITAFITHDGLFRFKRVCFGLASAPAAFQQLMTSILQGCKGVLCYLDDVIIFGKSEKEHMRNLEEVLQRISHAGLKLNDKCVFNTSELSFLGHRVSAEGVAPLQTKVDAIVHAATPTDAGKLRSFLGLVEYYARFVPRLAEEVEPMRRLLRKDTPFIWDTAAENSLTRVKNLLASHRVLQMFDPALPVIVATDASAYGLGAVLQQVDGRHIRTVAFASRTLTEAERKYSTGEREDLACLWALEKWHVYLWGRPVTLQTDHQALVALLSSQGTGQRPLRIARWTARLLRYNFTMQYRRGEHNKVADALSRLPLPDTEGGPESEEEIVSLVMCVHHDELKHATAEDSTLQDVARCVQTSWPPRKNVALNLTPYYEVRKELTVVDGILLRTERIVVPAKLTATFVKLAHESHPGIVKTKQRLREKYWWPGLDKHVETTIRSCAICQSADKSAKNSPTPLQPIPLPDKPWDKIAIDIVGPFERAPTDCRFVISVVDYFSKWPEVAFCADVTSRTVTKFLLSLFAREGYPTEIVSDHGRQFTSREFESFLEDRGIRHIFSAVYHPQANGLVERFNRVLKSYIQLALLEQRPVKATVTEYLGVYRATPHSTTGLSPAVLLHGRHMRTSLDVIGQPTADFSTNPSREMSVLRKRVAEHQRKSKAYADQRRAARVPKFQVGTYVRVKKPIPGPKGTPSYGPPLKILKRIGRWSFCLEDGRTWNASQLSAVPKEASPEQGTNIDISGAHDMPPLTDCHRRDVPSKTWITTPAGPHQTQEASSADQLASPSRPVPLPVPPSPPQPQGSQPHTLASGSRTVECSVPVEGNGLDAEPPPDRPRRNRRPPAVIRGFLVRQRLRTEFRRDFDSVLKDGEGEEPNVPVATSGMKRDTCSRCPV